MVRNSRLYGSWFETGFPPADVHGVRTHVRACSLNKRHNTILFVQFVMTGARTLFKCNQVVRPEVAAAIVPELASRYCALQSSSHLCRV
jgi:hypothetical protein